MLDGRNGNRQVRDDKFVEYYSLGSPSKSDERLSQALAALEIGIAMDLGKLRLKLALRTPSKTNVPRNTLMQSIREGHAEEGEEEEEAENKAEVAKERAQELIDAFDASLDPEVISRTLVRAIIDNFGRDMLIRAFARETVGKSKAA